jgi:hypothetical protein
MKQGLDRCQIRAAGDLRLGSRLPLSHYNDQPAKIFHPVLKFSPHGVDQELGWQVELLLLILQE